MSGEQETTNEHPAVVTAEDFRDDIFARCAVRTDTGLVRDHNEDDFLVMPEFGVYLVADGMGGHNAGSVASRICVETVEDYFRERDADGELPSEPTSHPDDHLARSLTVANSAIHRSSMEDRNLAGMGTTAVGVRLVGNRLTTCHAGDSRAYIFRNGHLRQISADHSLANFLRQLGRDAEARLAETTMSNVIMRALGLEPEVEIEMNVYTVSPGDRVLLCSDGLSDLVHDDDISAVLMNPELRRFEAAEELIDRALANGGRDNVTVMIVDVLDREGYDADDDDEGGRTLRFLNYEE